MSRVIIKLKDNSYINISADSIDIRNGLVYAWNGEYIVAVATLDAIEFCYLSEKKEEKENERNERN